MAKTLGHSTTTFFVQLEPSNPKVGIYCWPWKTIRTPVCTVHIPWNSWGLRKIIRANKGLQNHRGVLKYLLTIYPLLCAAIPPAAAKELRQHQLSPSLKHRNGDPSHSSMFCLQPLWKTWQIGRALQHILKVSSEGKKKKKKVKLGIETPK